MIAKAHSATLVGIEALPVVVEVDLQGPPPFFIMVGLPDKAVEESKERVRTAIKNSALDFPPNKIICNLAPGDIRKEGPTLDLPIAAAILAGSGQIPNEELADAIVLGELGLDGNLRPVDGAVNVALMARAHRFRRLILPAPNAAEAAVVPDLEVYGIRTLTEFVALLNGADGFSPHTFDPASARRATEYAVDYSEVKGQSQAIRALEVAAAGGHNVLMVGPPGSGKTMLARRMPTILPPLGLEESIEVTRIYSAAGRKPGQEGLIWERPFRSPHHTTSYAALVGGGKMPKPGEVSLAHLGVLFLDEMPEFQTPVLEALRQPLEDGEVTVSRVQSSLTFPAQCILIGAMNPTPGGYDEPGEASVFSPQARRNRYAAKISGPLLDRIDLQITVPKLEPTELLQTQPGEPSAAIRERVAAARDLQTARLGPGRVNAKMSPREIREHITLDETCQKFMKIVSSKLDISARAFDRILKVGRTIADLRGADAVSQSDLSEAVQYRSQWSG